MKHPFGLGDNFAEFTALFGPKPAPVTPPRPTITVHQLIERKTSIVRVGEKTYKITAVEVELTR